MRDSRPLTLERFNANCDRLALAGSDKRLLFEALPERVQAQMEKRRRVQIDDRRYVEGSGPFISRKPKRKPRKIQPVTPIGEEWRRGTEALASIPAETYLAILAPDSEPHRGRCRCPLPDHDDNNPSASYSDGRWYCFVCATGGGIFQLASALSGLGDRGNQFGDLRKWVAERVLGVPA